MRKIRAVAYPRYSSDNQREESLSAQMSAIEEYCNRKGYILVGSYPDEARSATTDNRPNFQKMIKDSAKGLFDVVVVHKLDRFARDRYDSAYYKRQLKINGVRLESVLEQFDNSPESIILESVLEGMAEYYSKNLAREARKGMLENAKRGLYVGGSPPYGYVVNPQTKRFEINEQEAKVVRLYYEGILHGKSKQSIADKLNSMGFRTRRGNKFTVTSFDTWGRNPRYKGVFVWDVMMPRDDNGRRSTHRRKPVEEQVIIPGAMPAIISEEMWEAVNAKLDQRRKAPGKMKAKVVYLLSGKVFCGKCGSVYSANSFVKKDKRYYYYRCNGECGNRQIQKEVLESSVIDQLVSLCFSDHAMKIVAEKVQNLYNKQKETSKYEIEPIRKELADIKKKLDNWIEALGDGLLDRSILAEKIQEANSRKESLEFELQRIEILNATNKIDPKRILDILSMKEEILFGDDDDAKKQTVDDFVDSVIVTPDNDPKGDCNVELKVRVYEGAGSGAFSKTIQLIETLQYKIRR